MIKRKQIAALIIVLAITLVIANCAPLVNKQQIIDSYPSWPAAPAQAKIKLINVFSVPADLEIKKGFWQWLGDVVLGSEAVSMVRPMAIVVHKEQQIYVADPGVHGVHLFDLKEQDYQLIKLADAQNMLSPVALAISADGDILITDSKQAVVYKYHYGDEHASILELDEGVEQPTGIIVDKLTDDIYIVDTKKHQIIVYDATGSFVRVIGKRGTGNGEFNYPTMVCWNSDGDLLVTDSLNFRVQVFTKNGHYLKQFGKVGDATGYQARPKGVASDYQNNIYVVDSLFHNVQIFNSEGRYLLSVGEQGQAPGQFWLPSGIHIDEKQKIYVADSYNQRVQVFQLMKAVK